MITVDGIMLALVTPLRLISDEGKISGRALLHPVYASSETCVLWAKVLYTNNEPSQFMGKSVKTL